LVEPNSAGGDKQTRETAERFALESGFPVIRETEPLSGSLPLTLLEKNIPSFTLELGESYVVNEKNIGHGVNSVEKIMSLLGMTDTDAEKNITYPLHECVRGKILDYSAKPYSSKSGIVRFLVKPGDIVTKGKSFARIYNVFGKRQETMRAEHNGVVLGHNDTSVAFPGMPVMAFGTI